MAMKCSTAHPRVAVVGAGMAGASCARMLADAGCAVQVVDKSRGPGGRLASRRLQWLDAQGQRRVVQLDHGAPAFMASGADFRQFLATALPPGSLAAWSPTLAPGSRPLDDAGALRGGVTVSTHASPREALAAAIAAADPTGRIVVFGSFFTVGGVLQDGVPRLQAKHLNA